MRIACWILKAKNTHSEYVIIIALPLQKWLIEAPQCYVTHTLPVLFIITNLLNMFLVPYTWTVLPVWPKYLRVFNLFIRCLQFSVFSSSLWSSLHQRLLVVTSTINQQMHLYNFHLKHLKPLRHVSIFSDHHQGVSSFLAKFIAYSRFSSFL